MGKLNGIRVSRVKKSIFIPLPKALWTYIGSPCFCPYCLGHPGIWDTLAVSTSKKDGHTWLIHAPELHGAKLKEPCDEFSSTGLRCSRVCDHAGPHTWVKR